MDNSPTASGACCKSRFPVQRLLVCAGSVAGAALGGCVGWAMDRFPALGLAPETFWRADPENVWAWSVIIGGVLGFAAAWSGLNWLAKKRTRTAPSPQS